MTYDITADDLSSEEAAHVYAVAPELEAGHYDYCPTCHKTGTYRWQGKLWTCDCATQLALAKHYTAAGVPSDYQRMSWADFVGEPPVEIRDYLAYLDAYVERGMGLVLIGTRGVGKTMLATLVLKQLIRRGVGCYTTTFASTVEAFTAGWGKDKEVQKEFFARKFMGSKVLLLDDLGKEFKSSTKLSESTFDHILRTREQNNRPTLLTTNYTETQLLSGYGDSILSMLVGKSKLVQMSGDDHRAAVNVRITAEVHSGETRPIQ